MKDQIRQHEDRIFEISQQVRALAWETKQRTESIKNLKREIRLVKRETQKEQRKKRQLERQIIADSLAFKVAAAKSSPK